jgi:hypothetical protein
MIFGTCLTLQTTLFFYDMIKFKLNSNLRSNRKAKELLDSSVTLLMISLGAVGCAVYMKRGISNFYKVLKQ